MKRLFAGLSDQGLVRKANQDSYRIDEPEGRFFIVADGMGAMQVAKKRAGLPLKPFRSFWWKIGKPSLIHRIY